MESLLDIYEVAQSIENDLNTISNGLGYDLNFTVYDDFETTDTSDIAVNEIPCILRMLTGVIDANQDHQLYRQTFILQSYGYEDTTDEFKNVLNQFAVNISGQVETLGNWNAVKDVTQTPYYIDRVANQSKERTLGQIQINYTFTAKGMLSNEASIYLDDVLVPTLSFNDTLEKTVDTSNKANTFKNTSQAHNSTYRLKADIIYLKENTAINKLVTEMYDSTKLKQTYSYKYNDPIVGDQTKTLILTSITKTHVSINQAVLTVTFLEGG